MIWKIRGKQTLIDWFIIITFSEQFFIYIKDENKINIIYNPDSKRGSDGTTDGTAFDCKCENIEIWVGMNIFFTATNLTTNKLLGIIASKERAFKLLANQNCTRRSCFRFQDEMSILLDNLANIISAKFDTYWHSSFRGDNHNVKW